MSASNEEARVAGRRAQQEPFVSTRCGCTQLVEERDLRRSVPLWYRPAGRNHWSGTVTMGPELQGARRREPAMTNGDNDERGQ